MSDPTVSSVRHVRQGNSKPERHAPACKRRRSVLPLGQRRNGTAGGANVVPCVSTVRGQRHRSITTTLGNGEYWLRSVVAVGVSVFPTFECGE